MLQCSHNWCEEIMIMMYWRLDHPVLHCQDTINQQIIMAMETFRWFQPTSWAGSSQLCQCPISFHILVNKPSPTCNYISEKFRCSSNWDWKYPVFLEYLHWGVDICLPRVCHAQALGHKSFHNLVRESNPRPLRLLKHQVTSLTIFPLSLSVFE